MFLSVVTFVFVLLSVISFVKTRPNYVHLILGGRLIGVTTIEEPSPERPKGGHGCLIGVAV